MSYSVHDKQQNKHKRTTSQSVRDYEQMRLRCLMLGKKFEVVQDYLKGLFGSNVTAITLLSRANTLEKMTGIQVDRLARRNRQALFCWFTENWEVIQPILLSNTSAYQKAHMAAESESEAMFDIANLLNYH